MCHTSWQNDGKFCWWILRNKELQQSTMTTISMTNSTTVMIVFQATCQDRLIVESDVEACESRIFCECCDFGCPECQCRWDEVEELGGNFLEGESIFSRLKDEEITASRARNLLYKFLIRISVDHWEKVFRWNFLTVAWRGFNPYWKTRNQKKKLTLASNLFRIALDLVVISCLFYYFHSFQ